MLTFFKDSIFITLFEIFEKRFFWYSLKAVPWHSLQILNSASIFFVNLPVWIQFRNLISPCVSMKVFTFIKSHIQSNQNSMKNFNMFQILLICISSDTFCLWFSLMDQNTIGTNKRHLKFFIPSHCNNCIKVFSVTIGRISKNYKNTFFNIRLFISTIPFFILIRRSGLMKL